MLAVERLRHVEVVVERPAVGVFVAGRRERGDGGARDAVLLEVGYELVLFAREERLRVDRLVIGLLDLAERAVEHALIAALAVRHDVVQVERRHAGAGIHVRIGIVARPLVGQEQGSAERGEREGERGGEEAKTSWQDPVDFSAMRLGAGSGYSSRPAKCLRRPSTPPKL